MIELEKPTILYRALFSYRRMGAITNPYLYYEQYKIIKYTKLGYWIDYFGIKKWTSKESDRRFAYPTKEEALYSLYRRCKRRTLILKSQLRDSEAGLLECKNLLKI